MYKVAIAALKRKKMSDSELEKLQGSRSQLEMHVNTLESAGMNQETMAAMKAVDVLKSIHGNLYVIWVGSSIRPECHQFLQEH